MNYPEPWPETDAEVHRWRITAPYDYFDRRAAIIDGLFAGDEYSIDAIALSALVLSSLAEWRFRAEIPDGHEKDQRRFRALLANHCRSSFVNRISIPEMLRQVKRDVQFSALDAPIRGRFPIAPMGARRRAEEDPIVSEFTAWASEQAPTVPEALLHYDYAGCIFKLYRNPVIHELRVAWGREARYTGLEATEERTIFYSNHAAMSDAPYHQADPVDYMRFGVYPPYLLRLLREAIDSVRAWALDNDRDLFD